jgi:hypothetical protein
MIPVREYPGRNSIKLVSIAIFDIWHSPFYVVVVVVLVVVVVVVVVVVGRASRSIVPRRIIVSAALAIPINCLPTAGGVCVNSPGVSGERYTGLPAAHDHPASVTGPTLCTRI